MLPPPDASPAPPPVHHLSRPDWLRTPAGAPRGYIQPERLDELWFHTGTACNLRCPFCLEGSRPGDTRIGLLTLAEAQPFMAEAVELGVQKFSFTGGEPFVNPQMVALLDHALGLRPCLVLTNATEPLANRLGEVLPLRQRPHPLNFRVSLDYPDPARHDAARGRGNFRLALSTLAQIHAAGFGVSLARLRAAKEDVAAVDALYRPYLAEAGLPPATRIISFPDFLPPGAAGQTPAITEDCMSKYVTPARRAAFMCNTSKMIVKQGQRLGVYACTLVDDDPDYCLAPTLRASMAVRVMLKHQRCFACFAHGATCSEGH